VEQVDRVIVQWYYWDKQTGDLHTFMTLDLGGPGRSKMRTSDVGNTPGVSCVIWVMAL
jgi:hypothetical protein